MSGSNRDLQSIFPKVAGDLEQIELLKQQLQAAKAGVVSAEQYFQSSRQGLAKLLVESASVIAPPDAIPTPLITSSDLTRLSEMRTSITSSLTEFASYQRTLYLHQTRVSTLEENLADFFKISRDRLVPFTNPQFDTFSQKFLWFILSSSYSDFTETNLGVMQLLGSLAEETDSNVLRFYHTLLKALETGNESDISRMDELAKPLVEQNSGGSSRLKAFVLAVKLRIAEKNEKFIIANALFEQLYPPNLYFLFSIQHLLDVYHLKLERLQGRVDEFVTCLNGSAAEIDKSILPWTFPHVWEEVNLLVTQTQPFKQPPSQASLGELVSLIERLSSRPGANVAVFERLLNPTFALGKIVNTMPEMVTRIQRLLFLHDGRLIPGFRPTPEGYLERGKKLSGDEVIQNLNRAIEDYPAHLPLYLARAQATFFQIIHKRSSPSSDRMYDGIFLPDLSGVLKDLVHFINCSDDSIKDDHYSADVVVFLSLILSQYFDAQCPVNYLYAPLSIKDTHAYLDALKKIDSHSLEDVLKKMNSQPSMLLVSVTRTPKLLMKFRMLWYDVFQDYPKLCVDDFATFVEIKSKVPKSSSSSHNFSFEDKNYLLWTLSRTTVTLLEPEHNQLDRSIGLLTDLIRFRTDFPTWGADRQDPIPLLHSFTNRAFGYRTRSNPGDLDLAIKDYEQALALVSVEEKTNTLLRMAGCYHLKGNYGLALQKTVEAYLKMLEILRSGVLNDYDHINKLNILDVFNALSKSIKVDDTPFDLSKIKRRDIRAIIKLFPNKDDKVRFLKACLNPNTHLGIRFSEKSFLETDARVDVEKDIQEHEPTFVWRREEASIAVSAAARRQAAQFGAWNTAADSDEPKETAPEGDLDPAFAAQHSDFAL